METGQNLEKIKSNRCPNQNQTFDVVQAELLDQRRRKCTRGKGTTENVAKLLVQTTDTLPNMTQNDSKI